MSVLEQGSQLILSAHKEPEQKIARIHIATPKEFMGRLIHSPYRFGFNRLEISFDDPKVMPMIRKFLDELLGFEIVDQTEHSCTIEMVAKGMENEFEKLLRRSMYIIQGMLREIAQGIEQGNHSAPIDIIEREKTVDKLLYFCMRVLNQNVIPPGKSNYLAILAWSLERIADDLCFFALSAKNQSILFSRHKSKTLRAVQLTERSFTAFMEFFSKPSQKSLLEARNKVQHARKEIEGQMQLPFSPLWSCITALDELLIFFPEGFAIMPLSPMNRAD